jgi:hypothetical protein
VWAFVLECQIARLIPKRKQPESIEFSSSFVELFSREQASKGQSAEQLRSDLVNSLDTPTRLVGYPRKMIPDAANSDARNAIQIVTDRLLAHQADCANVLYAAVSLEIRAYHQVREQKRRRLA